jgi:hypothetical protein
MAFKHDNHTHETVAEARTCASASVSARAVQRHEEVQPAMATEAQVEYIKSLLESREVTEDAAATTRRMLPNYTKSMAHKVIDTLKEYPVKAKGTTNLKPGQGPGWFPEFEDGYYALRNGDGVVHFYRLTHDDREGSRYFGWPCLQAQASDELHLIKNRAVKIEVIEKINEDRRTAQMLYAQELGNCYVCGRTLTDETSRELGIGPVCRGKKAAA